MPPALLLLAVVVLVAAFVQGATGMGFALIAVPVAALLEPDLVPVTVLLLMLPLNAHVVWRERTAIDWPGARWVVTGRFAGTFAGLWVLAVASGPSLELFIGVSTVAAALLALAAPDFTPARGAQVTAGVVTGVTETATGVGGPPLALVYQHASGPTLRATVALCFLVGEIISLVLLGLGGSIDAEALRWGAYLLLPLLGGAAASSLVHHRVDGPVVRHLVLGFAIVSGLVLALRAL